MLCLGNRLTTKLFVYGTLRNGEPATHYLMGYGLYDYGKFPYITTQGSEDNYVMGNVIDVTDEELARMDTYESIKTGLFVRERVYAYEKGPEPAPFTCYAYVGGSVVPRRIGTGDWLNQ